MHIHLLSDLPAALHPQAAALYWGAFSTKLGRLLGPDERAMALFCRVMQPDHALVACTNAGEVVGVAGFRSPKGSFLHLAPADLCAVHGRLGGLWRGAVLGWLAREVDNRRFLVDGLAVAEGWRGQGLGSALISALAREGRARGYPELRLDVSDHNTLARALYDRLGFVPAGHQRLRLLAPILGMTGATTMVRPL